MLRCLPSRSSTAPSKEILEEGHGQGIVTIGTPTTLARASPWKKPVSTWLWHPESRPAALLGRLPHRPICLVPQIVDAVGVPVVAAGENSGTRGSAAAFALGAHGAQMGTVFLACEESGATTFEPILH